MFHKILVGYDGSRSAKAALNQAAVMAKEYGAKITAIWVREPLPRHSDLPGEFEEESEAAKEYFNARRDEVVAVGAQKGIHINCEMQAGHPAKVMVTVADQGGYDLIVIGHSDHSGLWGRLLGDTADRIADHANCSVLIIKAEPKA